MMAIDLHGRRILEALGGRRRFHRLANGWQAGGLLAADADIADLQRRNLVAVGAGNQLRLTLAGEAWNEQQSGQKPAKRLLVERGLPEDCEADPKGSKVRRTRSVTVNLGESPLGWLMARGMISERQFAAGERLRADWTLAGLGPRVTMRWDPAPSAAKGMPFERMDPTVAQISARQRFDGAVAHIGRGLSDIAWRVICAGDGLAMAEAGLGWPKRAGKLVLGLALDRLADFYRIA